MRIRRQEEELHNMKKKLGDVKAKENSRVRRDEVQLDRLLGKGAYGEVMKGKFRGTEVAVKIPRPRMSLESVNREIEIISELQHPNVVEFIATVVDVKLPWAVLEYANRDTLEKLLKERPLELFEVFSLGLDAGYGLLHLHARRPNPILHRDLHPGNVLLFGTNISPVLKLSDFGMATFCRDTLSPNRDTTYTTKVREVFLLQSCFYCKAIFYIL